MHVLFVDDSYRSGEKYLGHGGFCIPDSQVSQLTRDIAELKDRFGIPQNVELKWSPGPGHYLNTKFKGSREQLWLNAIEILHKHNAHILCAVHDLKDCYGVTLWGWSHEQTRLWTTKQQLKYISERFEQPYLLMCDDEGLIIADEYGGRKGQASITEQASRDIARGTKYRQFEKLCILPLTTNSRYCPPLQLADITIGVTVASLAGSHFALRFFERLSKLYLLDPHERAISFASTFSSAVLGFGLTLFPQTFRARGLELFRELDSKYIYTSEGLQEKVP